VTEAATAVMLSPSKPHGWSQLAELGLVEDPYPAEMANLTAKTAAPPAGTLDADDFAKTFIGAGSVDDATRIPNVFPSWPTWNP